ncbi:bifunctional 4-hydroxy-2-oxoglutarate aldolase/2-dehydro-3-deoxy-phosphogluconate aldolase [Terrilactibacillus sp. BCM23-1]|uniref:Bifunctional 4-hydroxy-2-oxoglutarate aldolase/2-dehydro-3-deoxy-phosphogluconate aldolase n=1 Tax=Terrilactibacillus tamarindi TaxID=2599694 RepID=A0A6N8CQT7_9BACI|nr:bifunctional 4-hydroxy-2-oxoglutarate aldolase/2-dehydro-3-deoxy-phosphogluconate aldolase [Terrilactibacillus tamarindi]MTT32401.1 bifunctional 4-hydroxy-2-oxoglutarate aldolase/2-dehydro-3-deoxy-phosphogluconate aldolase [Terrilactibacillus tamarindi]
MNIDMLKNKKIVAIIRGATPENIIPIASALREGGISLIEITMEAPRALQALEALSAYDDPTIIAGAGTVLDTETAKASILSGAKFIFSPTVHSKTIQLTKSYGVMSIPGAYTPTEIQMAYENGADAIKVFPASTLGTGFFKQVAGPLPQIPLMATGGIDESNLADYLAAGAIAVGIGSSLVNTKQPITESYLTELTNKAKRYMSKVNTENPTTKS